MLAKSSLMQSIIQSFKTYTIKCVHVLVMLSLIVLLDACKVTRNQAKTISPEAKAFILHNHAVRIPIIPFTEPLAKMARKKVDHQFAPFFDQKVKALQLSITHDTISNVPVIFIHPKVLRNKEAVAIYIHGGAFLLGTANDLTALSMADKLGITVISVNYQLSPKVKYPVALNEIYAVYAEIIKRYAPNKTVVIGESAGGNLALSVVLKARDSGLPMPAGMGLFTPWTDLTGAGDSYRANEHRDRVIAWKNQLDKATKVYVNKSLMTDPLVSPAYADYSKGFPSAIITTGTRDLFLSNCVRLYWDLKNAKVPVELRIWEGMWHGFESEQHLPEGAKCIDEVANYLIGFTK